jgi:hypothetical protein
VKSAIFPDISKLAAGGRRDYGAPTLKAGARKARKYRREFVFHD